MSFIIGNFIALWFREELRREQRKFFHPCLGAGLVFECFFYVPLGIYLYYFHPAWSWMYFFDPNSLTSLELAVLGVAMVSCYLLSLVIGFQLAQFLIRKKQDRAVMIILAVALIGLGLFCLFTRDRLLWVGDFPGGSKGSNMVLLLKHRLSWINSIMAILGFGSLALLLRKLKGISDCSPR